MKTTYQNQTTELPNSAPSVTSTPVLCKDGTTQNQKSSPNAEYMDACVNNGGRAKNQPTPTTTQGSNNNETFLQKHKNHLIIAVVLVAGYFAYKKFKK